MLMLDKLFLAADVLMMVHLKSFWEIIAAIMEIFSLEWLVVIKEEILRWDIYVVVKAKYFWILTLHHLVVTLFSEIIVDMIPVILDLEEVLLIKKEMLFLETIVLLLVLLLLVLFVVLSRAMFLSEKIVHLLDKSI